MPFDNIYLKDLYIAVCTILPDKVNDKMADLIKNYKNFYEKNELAGYNTDLLAFIEKTEVGDTNITALPLGLKGGLAGYMLNSVLT
jgi:hypothetical protein